MKSVMRAICGIEQKLLFSDSSPSIHSEVQQVTDNTNKQVGLFMSWSILILSRKKRLMLYLSPTTISNSSVQNSIG